jgi:hypothetical protein
MFKSSESYSRVWILNNNVLEAFEGSVKYDFPLVKFHKIQVSTVPKSSLFWLYFDLGISFSIHFIFVAEK